MAYPTRDAEELSRQDISLAQIRLALKNSLVTEKARLIESLAALLTQDDELVATRFGARGHLFDLGLSGMIYANCSRSGKPCSMTGVGTTRYLLYHWIPVVYEDDIIGRRSYMLTLSQFSLDTQTGNPHTDFFSVQFIRNGFNGLEVGGQPNPRPERTSAGYLLHLQTENYFPSSDARTSLYDAPWGLKDFHEELPCLDMTADDYNPDEVMRYFMKLIAADIVAARQ